MQPSSKAREYVEQVCNEIRWQKAHAVVQEELYAHIEDQKEAYLLAGVAEEEADALSVEEMGNPLETGSHFDKLYRPHIEWNVILFAAIIIAAGSIMRLGLLKAAGEEIFIDEEILILLLGIAVMVYGYRLDYITLFRHYFSGKVSGIVWAVLCTFAVFIVFYAGWHVFNGSMMWIVVNGNHLFSHYIGLLWPVVMCAFVCMQYKKGSRGYLYSFAFLLFSMCVFANSSSAMFLLMGTGFAMLCYALWKNWFGCSRKWGFTFLMFPLILFVMSIRYPHRIHRLYSVLNPFSDPMGYGYTFVQIFNTLQETQFFHSGDRNLLYAVENIPNLLTDHLLTAAVVHWGWISLVPLLLAYGMLFYLGWKACFRVKSQIGRLLVITINTVWIIQLAVYLCNGFTPLQLLGYPLLFVQGRYAKLSNMFLLGLVLSVYKTGAVQKDELVEQNTKEEDSIFLKKPITTKQELEAFLKLEYNLEEPLFSDWKESKEKQKKASDI